MRIRFEEYDPAWKDSFDNMKKDLIETIGHIALKIEHIGSTSVTGLSAKPIIDILVGIADENELDQTITPLLDRKYIYYKIHDRLMPYRRFFVKHQPLAKPFAIPSIIQEEKDIPKNTNEHNHRLAHIHILPFNSEHWVRHIAFRDYLRTHPNVRSLYQDLKGQLSKTQWEDGNDYNRAKDAFLKAEEQNAIEWFNKTQKTQP